MILKCKVTKLNFFKAGVRKRSIKIKSNSH